MNIILLKVVWELPVFPNPPKVNCLVLESNPEQKNCPWQKSANSQQQPESGTQEKHWHYSLVFSKDIHFFLRLQPPTTSVLTGRATQMNTLGQHSFWKQLLFWYFTESFWDKRQMTSQNSLIAGYPNRYL